MDEMRSGMAAVIEMSNISISRTNSIPAMGALKMPAIAPAAPQPSRRMMFLCFRWNHCPMLEPMALPVVAIGASSPTEPPNATVMVEAMMELYMLCRGIFPPPREMA